MPADCPPTSHEPIGGGWHAPQSPRTTQIVLSASAAFWCLLSAAHHDSAWPIAFGGGLVMAVLPALPLVNWRHGKTPSGFGLTPSDLSGIVLLSLMFIWASTLPLMGAPPLGIAWGVAACAGMTLGTAFGYAIIEWRASP